MSTRWELATYDRDNQLVLVVEVKSKLDAPPEWAARLRRNILAHGTFPNAPYFLMVFPDRFYLWKNIDSSHEPIEPTYVIDARPILQQYFDQSGITADQVSGQSLELIVASWLNEIIHKTPDEVDASQQWLIDSGLYNAVVGGRLDHEVLV
jgi:hypothetical protein